MARNQTSTAEAESTNESAAATNEGETPAKSRPSRLYIVVPMPSNLKERLEADAKTAEKAAGPYVRDFLAQQLGVTIEVTETARRSKYASDDERKAAQAKRNTDRSATMKLLMATFRKALKDGVDPGVAAQLAAAQAVTGPGVEAEAEPAAEPVAA